MNKVIRICAAALCAAAIVAMVIWSGVKNRQKTQYTRNTIVMGTAASFTVYGSDGDSIIDDIADAEDTLDKEVLSWRAPESELAVLNAGYKAGEDYKVSDELADIIGRTLQISEAGDDKLDITIRPLAEVWGIEDGRSVIPDKADIDAALKKVDGTNVSVDSDFVNIADSGMMLDLGAVGKGYGCDLAADYLKDSDATGACIALGGSIVVYGSKPDGGCWKVGVKDPRNSEGTVLGTVSIPAGETTFISTSGDYEKYFMVDGKRYHHILDPDTGYPAWTHTIAATVVCDDGLTSDALSTLCMLLDRDDAMKLVAQYGAKAVIIDDEKRVYVSDDLKSSFNMTASGYTIADD